MKHQQQITNEHNVMLQKILIFKVYVGYSDGSSKQPVLSRPSTASICRPVGRWSPTAPNDSLGLIGIPLLLATGLSSLENCREARGGGGDRQVIRALTSLRQTMRHSLEGQNWTFRSLTMRTLYYLETSGSDHPVTQSRLPADRTPL